MQRPVRKNIAVKKNLEKKSSIAVSNEVKLDTQNPIPREYTGTSFYSSAGNSYIPFLHPKDNFFNVLQEARIESVTQSACVGTKSDYTIGEGLRVENLTEEELPQKYKDFRKKANNKRETINAVLKQAILGFYGSGNSPVEIVRGEVAGTRFIHVFAHNVLDCRLRKDEDGEITSMVHSKALRRAGMVTGADSFKIIPLYDQSGLGKETSWIKDEKTGVERTGIWLKNHYPGYDDYGMPSSLPSLIYQVIEYQGARYNLDNLENNMVIGGALVLSGNLAQGEATKLGRKIISQHTGSGKRGRVAVFSSEQGIENSKYFPFDTKKEGSYKELMAQAEDKIIFANQWDSVLAGLQTKGALGKGAGYLKEVYEQKLNSVIKPVQNFLIEHLMQPIAEIAQDWLNEDWSKLKFHIKPIQIAGKADNELNNSPQGITAFLEIVKAVSEGWYTREAAIQLISNKFGVSVSEAEEQLGELGKFKEDV